jgi:hypothetical protein
MGNMGLILLLICKVFPVAFRCPEVLFLIFNFIQGLHGNLLAAIDRFYNQTLLGMSSFIQSQIE